MNCPLYVGNFVYGGSGMKVTFKPSKKEFVFLLVVLGLVLTFLITDIVMLEKGNEPIFCVSFGQYLDGGTKEYYGLGYKIIDYNILDGFDGYKLGTWFMTYNNNL